MKMKCDNFKLDEAKRDDIVAYKKKYGDSALSSKDVVYMADCYALECIGGLEEKWKTLEDDWRRNPFNTEAKKEFYQRHLDAMEDEARKLYVAASKKFGLEGYCHTQSIIPKVRTLYEPPAGTTSKGTIMVVLSMGFMKGVRPGPNGEWELELAKEVFTNKFLLASIDAFNTTDDPDVPCNYTIVCTEAHTLEGLNAKKSKPWHTPKKGHKLWVMCKNILKLQIGAHAPKVLILHSAPARGVFGFEEGEIGFSGEKKHCKNFEFPGGKRLVDFNIFIEAFDHPASARFVRLFWQMTREAKKLSKLIGA